MDGAAPGTETATVLVSDVVGSTSLRQQLGEDAADRFQAAHEELMRRVVAEHAGRVVKGLGDGVLAVFGAAADAVGAAVAAQRAVVADARTETAGADVAIRIGISAGDVAATSDGDVHGTAVVEASRLCDQAQGRQILVADLVRALARGRGGFDFEPIGGLSLKGIDTPVAACEVGWRPLAEGTGSSLPFPTLLTPPTSVAYAGRILLLERLLRDWDAVRSTPGARTVLLSGEPGIGKTRTACEVARRVFDGGGLVLYGRCDEALSTPYQPFVEALDWQTRHDPTVALGRTPGELGRLLPDLGRRVPGLPTPVGSDPRVEQHRLFEAVTSWLGAASTDRPLLLVLDDLHWAGEPTLQLLDHVQRRLSADRDAHVLMLGTYRDTDIDRVHPLAAALGELRRIPNVERVAVDNLSADEVVELMEAAAGHALDDQARRLAAAAYAETDGNPFFVGEILRHFIETGVIRFDAGRWTVVDPERVDVPEGVRDVVGRRLLRLSPETNTILRTAAVLGRDVDVEVLTGMCDAGVDDVLDAVDEALGARLLQEAGADTVRFSHAIVRTTLYEEISAPRRRRAHARAVEVIADVRPDDLESLAFHAIHAGPVDGRLDPAIGYCVAAGDRARDKRAHADAARWYQQALELAEEQPPEDPRVVLDARCGLGECQRDQGDAAHRETLLATSRAALADGHLELAVRSATANSRLSLSIVGAVDREKVAILEELVDRLPAEARAERAKVLALLGTELTFDPSAVDRRAALIEESLGLARSLGGTDLEAWVLVATGLALQRPGRALELEERVQRALALSEDAGDPALLCMAYLGGAQVALNRGDLGTARSRAEAGAQLAAQEASPAIQWMTRAVAAQYPLAAGRVAEVRAENAALLEFGQTIGEPDAAVWWTGFEVCLGWIEGTFTHWLPAFEALTEEYPDFVAWPCNRIGALAALGRLDEAEAVLHETGLDDPSVVPPDWAQLTSLGMLAWAARLAGWADLGRRLLTLLAPYRDEWTHVGVFTLFPTELTVGFALTAAGQHDEAVAATRRARQLCLAADLRAHLPVLGLYLAMALLDRGAPGDADEARAVATEAQAAAEELGMSTLAARLGTVGERRAASRAQ